MAELPPGEERDRQQLAFRLALGPALLAARGYASDEVERNYQEAGRLAEALSDREAVFTSARGQWHYLYDRSQLDRALALAERLCAIGTEDSSAEKSCLAFRAVGSTLMSKGEFARAIEAFERVITRGSQAPLGTCFAHHGEEPHIVALQYKGLSLAVRGYADTGLASAQSALSLAKTLNFPLMVAFASTAVGMVLMLRREYQPCAALVRRANRVLLGARFHFLVGRARNPSRRLAGLSRQRPARHHRVRAGHPELEEDRGRAAYPDLVVLSRRGGAVRRRS